MLPNEITPFAEHHREKLTEAIEELESLPGDHHDSIVKLENAREAFVRFRVCMEDEVRQKTLYRDRWLSLRSKR